MQPAGIVLLIVVASLLLAALLNAPALLRDAEGKPLGFGRDLSIAIWRPVATVSGLFGIDRAHEAAESALGRTPDGPTIVVTVPPTSDQATAASDAATTTVAPTTTVPPTIRPADPSRPYEVLLVGDSTMESAGRALQRQLAETGLATGELDYRAATGLSRPDYYDWPSHIAGVTAEGAPEVSVAMFGANDAQSFELDGTVYEYGSAEWQAVYRARVGTTMDLLTADGGWLVWIGQPQMRSSDFDGRMALIDSLYQAEAELRPRVLYLDSRNLLTDANGGYIDSRTKADGGTVRLRADDGIHLTIAGGEEVAAAVIDLLVSRTGMTLEATPDSPTTTAGP